MSSKHCEELPKKSGCTENRKSEDAEIVTDVVRPECAHSHFSSTNGRGTYKVCK